MHSHVRVIRIFFLSEAQTHRWIMLIRTRSNRTCRWVACKKAFSAKMSVLHGGGGRLFGEDVKRTCKVLFSCRARILDWTEDDSNLIPQQEPHWVVSETIVRSNWWEPSRLCCFHGNAKNSGCWKGKNTFLRHFPQSNTTHHIWQHFAVGKSSLFYKFFFQVFLYDMMNSPSSHNHLLQYYEDQGKFPH